MHRDFDDLPVTVQFEAIDAELAAEALASWADAGREAARREAEAGYKAEAEITETHVAALDRACDAIRAALARHSAQ